MGATATTPRQQLRRETILAVAREMFLSEGYAATSMSAIAAKLGGSKGTLYNYFNSKEELFTAVMVEQVERIGDLMDSLALDHGDVADRLRTFAFEFLKLILSDDFVGLYRLVTAEVERFPEIGGSFNAAAMNTRKEEVSRFFARQMDAGALRKDDPELAARRFKDLCRSDLQRLRAWNVIPPPSDQELRRHADQAVDAIMRLYAPGA